jgi:hypothetical protein
MHNRVSARFLLFGFFFVVALAVGVWLHDLAPNRF